MEANDYVSYELAKKIYDTDFNLDCEMYYYFHSWMEKPRLVRHTVAYAEQRKFDGVDIYPAPTLWQAQKWLREVKGIAINVIAHEGDGDYHWMEVLLPNFKERGSHWYKYRTHPFVSSYEEALSDGLNKMFDLFRKGG